MYRVNNRVARRRYGWLVIPAIFAVVLAVEVFAFLNIVTWAVEIGFKLLAGG